MSHPSGTPIPARIFISHTHFDNAFCRAFVSQLRRELALPDPDAIFYDESSFHIADTWMEKMQREVLARPIFVVVLSPHAVAADFVKMEVNLALSETIPHPQARRIICVLVEACDVDTLAPALRLYQMADIPRKGYDQSFAEIIGAIREATGLTGADAQPTSTRGTATAQPAQYTAPAVLPPSLAQTLAQDAQAALTARHYDDAILKAQYALKRPEAAPLADALRDILAAAYAGAGRWAEARDTLLAMSEATQQRPEYWRQLATAQRHLKQPTEALAALDNARIFTPYADTNGRRSLLTERRVILIEQQRWDDALGVLAEEQSLAPAGVVDPGLLRIQRDILMQAQRPAEALQVAQQIATTRTDSTANDWLTFARLIRTQHPSPADASDTNVRQSIQHALDESDRRADATGHGAITQARRDLLPAPILIPAERFPARLASLGFVAQKPNGIEVITPPLCDVPAGAFLMGSDTRRDSQARSNEQPQQSVTLADYQIGKYPVTVAEYACFVRSGAREPSDWQNQLQRLDHPVVYVSWNDALAYVRWLAKTTGQLWRLPTEAEWEKAARGTDGRIYPWGDTFDPNRCNVDARNAGGGYIQGTTPVGSYPTGESPYHAQDMAGNVWEWCSTLYQSYSYSEDDGRENLNSTGNRVLRGGSWDDGPEVARAAYRYDGRPVFFSISRGFRLVVARSRLA